MSRCSKGFLFLELALIGLLAAAPAAAQARRFAGDFTEWGVYDRNYVPADIPADSLTHINYAFVVPEDPDGDGYYDCTIADTWAALEKPLARLVPGTRSDLGENLGTLNQLRRLRAYQQSRGKSLLLLFAVGGWGYGDAFSAAAVDAPHRQHLAASCVQLMRQQGFDGLDIDWEYPALSETGNLTSLLQDLRNALQAQGNDPYTGTPYLLTLAGPAGYYRSRFDVANIAPKVDWVNVMTYDFAGCWGMNHTGHSSPLQGSLSNPDGSTKDDQHAIQDWISNGMPAAKINFGLPYYGKIFQALQSAGPTPTTYPGRYAPIDPALNDSPNCAPGTWGADGDLDYWDIVQRYVNVNGYSRIWDAEQRVPMLYKDAASYWISYDDPTSLAEKVDWAKSVGLGGVFVWELSMERAPGSTAHPLTDVAAAHLNP